MSELFPDELAVATYHDFKAQMGPWCWMCGGFGVYSDRHDKWHVCTLKTGHGRFLPRSRWKQEATA